MACLKAKFYYADLRNEERLVDQLLLDMSAEGGGAAHMLQNGGGMSGGGGDRGATLGGGGGGMSGLGGLLPARETIR